MDRTHVPRSRTEVAALEAAYPPFEPAAAWSSVACDSARWQRHADALREVVKRADPQSWERTRTAFMRAAALDSTALAELIRPVPQLTTVVLRSSVSDESWSSLIDAAGVVVECHRRALLVASDAVEAGTPVNESLIARLQDLIVESQRTYTVTIDGTERREVELPRRQYKSVSNFLVRADEKVMRFAPANQVADEMRRLTAELASDAFARLHPVVQSTYSHSALIRVHPFPDGNGRLARTLSCMPLLRAVGLPLLILADQWPAYTRALRRWDDGDLDSLVQVFFAAHVNTLDLARNVLETAIETSRAAGLSARYGTPTPARRAAAERTLIDLIAVHLREAIGDPGPDRQVALTRGADRETVRTVIVEPNGDVGTDIVFGVEQGQDPAWLQATASTGDTLDVWRSDIDPMPVEMLHLRVRSWLDRLLARRVHGLPESAHVRGLFVLGAPRSGTTLMGNWLGSHPDVLRLAEYGGFYVANSIAPSHLTRLPGAGHETFLRRLRRLAVEDSAGAARRQGCTWFCDATPWNLEAAAALADALPDAVFVLMLRHFAGAVVSLHQFPWAGETWTDAAEIWVRLNGCIDQLPEDRTIVVSYDVLAAHPADTISGVREALGSVGLDPRQFDDRQFAASHAHVIGAPRPTIAALRGGRVVFRPRASLDEDRWTPEVHAEVWPVVAATHRRLQRDFVGGYESPPRPAHVPEDEW